MILQLRNIRLLRPFVYKKTPVSLIKHCSGQSQYSKKYNETWEVRENTLQNELKKQHKTKNIQETLKQLKWNIKC